MVCAVHDLRRMLVHAVMPSLRIQFVLNSLITCRRMRAPKPTPSMHLCVPNTMSYPHRIPGIRKHAVSSISYHVFGFIIFRRPLTHMFVFVFMFVFASTCGVVNSFQGDDEVS